MTPSHSAVDQIAEFVFLIIKIILSLTIEFFFWFNYRSLLHQCLISLLKSLHFMLTCFLLARILVLDVDDDEKSQKMRTSGVFHGSPAVHE